MTGDWHMVPVGVLLTAGTAVFVAAEFSLVTTHPAGLRASHHPPAAHPRPPP